MEGPWLQIPVKQINRVVRSFLKTSMLPLFVHLYFPVIGDIFLYNHHDKLTLPGHAAALHSDMPSFNCLQDIPSVLQPYYLFSK